jgi:predicted Zn-dependent peptidase
MKMKVDLLQKKLAEEEKRYGRDRNLDDGDNFGVKSSFSETDLLQFDHVKQNNANGLEEEVLKLQAKIQELTTNYNEKTEKIVNLQNLLLAAENKNKTIANEYKEYAERSTKKYLEEQEKCKK